MQPQNFRKIERAGDFNLVPIINLIPYTPDSSGSQNRPDTLNILPLVLEIKIYEDILKPFLSGVMTVADATNIFHTTPISGFERLEFQVMTPNIENNYDFTIETGHPLHIYSIENRKQISQSAQAYNIHFCSQEMIKNRTNFVSETVHNNSENIVAKMLHQHMRSKKKLLYDTTFSRNKFVLPFANPLTHIQHISKKTQSFHHKSGRYLFFENINGFNFRSMQSLMTTNQKNPRNPIHGLVYRPSVPHLRQGGDEILTRELQIISEYEVIKQFDTLRRLNHGVFCSELVTHDMLGKTFTTKSFNYRKEFELNGKLDNNSVLPDFPYIGEAGFEHLPSKRYFRSNTKDIFEPLTQQRSEGSTAINLLSRGSTTNPISTPDEDDMVQSDGSKDGLLFDDFMLRITVPGYLGVFAGAVVGVEIPKLTDASELDEQLSGLYLVRSVEHILSMEGKGTHVMVLNLVKDSFRTSFPKTDANTFDQTEVFEASINDMSDI